MTTEAVNGGEPGHAPRRPALMLYLVKQLELVVRARIDDLLRPTGVTALQYTALSVLERRPSMSTSDLARASFVRNQSAADLVSVLVRHGFIERSVDSQNRRRRLLRLTAAGRTFLAEYDEPVTALERRMLEDLTGTEQATFRTMLSRSRRSLSRSGRVAADPSGTPASDQPS